MIYDIFIRRPRLAMVISIVVTLAGLISMTVIPVVLVMAGWVLLITYVPGLTLGLGQILGR